MVIHYYDWGTFAEWLIAIGTLGAIFVALFAKDITNCLRGPRFVVDFSHENIVVMPILNQQNIKVGRGYFYRLSVKNIGKEAAENVQVIIGSLEKKNEDGNWGLVPAFVPIRLLWTHIEKPILPNIPSQISGVCNLLAVFGFDVFDPRIKSFRARTAMQDYNAVLKLLTEVEPSEPFDLLAEGEYRMRIAVASTNAKTKAVSVVLKNGVEKEEDLRKVAHISLVLEKVKVDKTFNDIHATN